MDRVGSAPAWLVCFVVLCSAPFAAGQTTSSSWDGDGGYVADYSNISRLKWMGEDEPDSYLDETFKNTPHVAWMVDDIEPWIAGKEIAIAPFHVGDPPFVRVAFVWEEGMISEYMAFVPGSVWFDPNDAGTGRALNE